MPHSATMLQRFLRAARRSRRGFVRDERGVTMIEFAILALPFFGLLAAILETALVFLASQILDTAVQDASRLISTGQAQAAGYTAASFRTAVCNELFNMFDCSKLKIKTTVVSNFATATVPPPVDPVTNEWTVTEQYAPGSGSQVIMVQVFYKWPIILNFAGLNLQTSSDGTRLLSAVRVFRNEPFS